MKAKKRKTADARVGTRTREMQRKLLLYAFLDKYGGNKRGTVASRTGRTRRPGAQRPKTTHRKASGSLSDVFVCLRQGEERELKPKGISGGVLIEQCVVLSSSVVQRCSVQKSMVAGHLHSCFAVVDRVNFQVRPNRFVVVFRVQPLRVNCWSGRRLRKPRCLPVP